MQDLHGYYLEDLSIGMSASYAKTISESDVYLFAGISGDNNPVHINEQYAANTLFGKRVVHGMFSAALISTVAGTRLPGPGAIYIDQQISFKAPVYIGDTVNASLTITGIDEQRGRVQTQTDVHVGDRIVATGNATFRVSKRPS